MQPVSGLTDSELLQETARLAASERAATASLIRALNEVDARRLYLSQGFSCMFNYCTQALRLAEDGAYRRIEVARVSRVFPSVLDALEAGELTLTTAVMVAPHLTPDNERQLLDECRFKSKREVERVLAARNQTGSGLEFVMHFKVDEATYDRFLYARGLMRHQIPDGSTPLLFQKAIEVLIAHVERHKLSLVERPKPARVRRAHGRRIPAAVQRAVWRRDEARCAFRGPMGRCSEKEFLEFHHVRPFAEGGHATVENIELRCRAHNAYEAELMFQA